MKPTRAIDWVLLLAVLGCATPANADEIPEHPPPSDNAAVWYLTPLIYGDLPDEDQDQIGRLSDNSGAAFGAEAFDYQAAKELVERHSKRLYYIRRGATLPHCDWAVDLKQGGPLTVLPHLGYLRRMARLLNVSARVRLESGDVGGAIADWMAMMRMARHAAADGIVISCHVQYSIEAMALHGITPHLHRLSRAQLERLGSEWDRLPPRRTIRDAVASEQVIVDWLRRERGLHGRGDFRFLIDPYSHSPQQVKVLEESLQGLDAEARHRLISEGLDAMDAHLVRMHALLGLAGDELQEAHEALEREVRQAENPVLNLLIRDFASRLVFSDKRVQSRGAMLDAMIAYRLGGKDAFDLVVDPYDGKPFGFEATGDGVALTSRLKGHDDEPWSLTFPAELAQRLPGPMPGPPTLLAFTRAWRNSPQAFNDLLDQESGLNRPSASTEPTPVLTAADARRWIQNEELP